MDNYHHTLFTDGACKGNPGPGGWGASIWSKAKGAEEHAEANALFGGERATTNNRMELSAVIEALCCLIDSGRDESDLLIVVDSEYVLKGATEWINGWIRRGWVKSNKEPVVNADLWKQLVALAAQFKSITWMWVRGHSGHPGNERADKLANAGYRSANGGV
jgi:ribonuclease HI